MRPPNKFITQEEKKHEKRMNLHIGDYDVDSVILDLGLDINILTKANMGNDGKTVVGLVHGTSTTDKSG